MNSSQVYPIEIKRQTASLSDGVQAGTQLTIRWSNGDISNLDSTRLRTNCPCASCLESRGDASHQKPLTGGRSLLRVVKSDLSQQTNLAEIWTVGNYAIGIRWGDGHNTGIYTYSLLRDLCSTRSQVRDASQDTLEKVLPTSESETSSNSNLTE